MIRRDGGKQAKFGMGTHPNILVITAMIGLQHETKHIDRLGFEDLSGYGVDPPGSGGKAMLPGWPVGGKGLSAIEVADRAAAFLRRARTASRPFFAQVGFFETHTPYGYAGCQPDDTLGVWTPPYALRPGVHDWAGDLNRVVADPGLGIAFILRWPAAGAAFRHKKAFSSGCDERRDFKGQGRISA